MCRISDKSLILNKIKLHYKLKNNVDFAKYLGIAPTTLSNWYTRNSIDYELIFTLCEDIDMNWVLSGKGEMLKVTKESDQKDHECKRCQELDKYNDLQDKYIKKIEEELHRCKQEEDLKRGKKAG